MANQLPVLLQTVELLLTRSDPLEHPLLHQLGQNARERDDFHANLLPRDPPIRNSAERIHRSRMLLEVREDGSLKSVF